MLYLLRSTINRLLAVKNSLSMNHGADAIRPKTAAPAESMERAAKVLFGIDVQNEPGAEIGPLDRPLVQKESSKVFYVDHCDTETLRQRWSTDSGVDIEKLHVDAVWGEQTLRMALSEAKAPSDGLAYVIASHVVEHVPDLVSWLKEVHEVLAHGGFLRLVVPDRRFTFDYLRRVSGLTDVLDAFIRKRRAPSASRVLDFTLNMVTVDCAAAWRGNLDTTKLTRQYSDEDALGLAADAEINGTYHDVHCWVFTPHSFAELMAALSRCQLLEFECEWLVPTSRDTFEFFVSLKPSPDYGRNAASWRRVAIELSSI